MTITIASNATIAKLLNAPDSAVDEVAELLSYKVDGSEFMYSVKSNTWSGISSFFNYANKTFPAGFVHLVEKHLRSAKHQVRLVRKKNIEPLGPEDPIVDSFGNGDPRYDYQLRSLRQVEKHGRGIIQVATGGGKTKIAKLIISRYRRMTLFLTTRKVLMHQMKDSCDEMGMRVGILGDGEWTPCKGINVGMVQTFIARLAEPNLTLETTAVLKSNPDLTRKQAHEIAKERFADKFKQRDRTIRILEMFDVVIGEEAHEAGGNSYYEILRHCKNASIRVALTATPFMRDSTADNMRLMAAFGPILIKVSEKLLIDRGILARPIFKFQSYEPHPKLRRTSPWQRARQIGIVESPGRNASIIAHAKMAAAHGLSVLILVTLKAHGDYLRDKLRDAGVKVAFIRGENDQDERKAALDRLASGDLDVVIGTTILDVGVDVPSLGMIILAGGGKAEVAHRQRIGRGLRAKKNGPNVAFILDFEDGANQHLIEHAAQRRYIVEQTAGFGENILPQGQDFDWTLFKKTAA